jgi:hypothetical protein
VAAVFRTSLEESRDAVDEALTEWRETLGTDVLLDFSSDPRIVTSDEGFRVVFKIQPGSRFWRDWAVALVSTISSRLGNDSFVGFFDAVAGRMHPASRPDLLG